MSFLVLSCLILSCLIYLSSLLFFSRPHPFPFPFYLTQRSECSSIFLSLLSSFMFLIFLSLNFTFYSIYLNSIIFHSVTFISILLYFLLSTKTRIDHATKRFTLPDTSHINTHNAHVPPIFVIQVRTHSLPELWLLENEIFSDLQIFFYFSISPHVFILIFVYFLVFGSRVNFYETFYFTLLYSPRSWN